MHHLLKQTLRHATLLAGLIAGSTALAHTAWLEPDPTRPGHYQLLFGGHAGALVSYAPEKLRTVTALDRRGDELPVQQLTEDNGVVLILDDQTALLGLHFDNGIWSRDPMGRSVELPMRELAGAQSGTRALKYHKTIFDWSTLVTRPLGQAFEVTPIDAGQPMAGQPMQLRITLDGQPLEGVRLGHGEEGDAGISNAQGIASFVPRPGFNRLWAGKRFPAQDPDYTQLSYEYLLGFDAVSP